MKRLILLLTLLACTSISAQTIISKKGAEFSGATQTSNLTDNTRVAEFSGSIINGYISLSTLKSYLDYYTKTESDGKYSLLTHTHTFSSITSKPTTISGYGITDTYSKDETNTFLANKVDKESGKGLSTNDYTTAEKTKLSGIATGATANSSDATLLNRSNHTGTQAASTITGLATVATSGSYNDLSNKPTVVRANEITEGYLWLSRNGGPPFFATQQSTGNIAEFRQGGLYGDYMTNIENDGSVALYNGRIKRYSHVAGYLEGSYNTVGNSSSKTNPIYTIGGDYTPNENDLNNMYGIGFTTPTASFINSTDLGVAPSGGWGLYVASDGNARIYLRSDDGSGYFGGHIYANQGVFRSNVTTIAPTASNHAATKGWVEANYETKPYKVISGLISQSGTSAPTLTILKNDTTASLSASRTSTGQYTITLSSSILNQSKTWLYIGKNFTTYHNTLIYSSSNTLGVYVTNSSNTYIDSALGYTSFEIRIYP